MLLELSTTWALQDLTWRTRFIVESSSHLRVRTIEGFLSLHEDPMHPNKWRRKNLCATNELIFHNALLQNDHWHFEMAITRWSPIFNLHLYGQTGCQFIKTISKWPLLTEYFFIGLTCSVVPFLESWELGTNLARSFASRRWLSRSLSVHSGHVQKKRSSEEAASEPLIYGLETQNYLYCHIPCGLLGPTGYDVCWLSALGQ